MLAMTHFHVGSSPPSCLPVLSCQIRPMLPCPLAAMAAVNFCCRDPVADDPMRGCICHSTRAFCWHVCVEADDFGPAAAAAAAVTAAAAAAAAAAAGWCRPAGWGARGVWRPGATPSPLFTRPMVSSSGGAGAWQQQQGAGGAPARWGVGWESGSPLHSSQHHFSGPDRYSLTAAGAAGPGSWCCSSQVTTCSCAAASHLQTVQSLVRLLTSLLCG